MRHGQIRRRGPIDADHGALAPERPQARDRIDQTSAAGATARSRRRKRPRPPVPLAPGRRMIRFLQPEWLWLLALLPMVILLRGRRGPVAAIEVSDVGLAREVARSSRSRAGGWLCVLPVLGSALTIV